MAALTFDRNSPERLGNLRAGPVAAGVRIFAGALIMRTANGHLAPGAVATGAVGAGRADIAANNTGGAAGAIRVDWRRGVFRFNNGAAADLIGLAERNEAQAILREQHAHARVDDAFARGYLSPAMRDWALALCQSDEASFDQFIVRSVPQFAHLGKPATTSAMPPMPQAQDHSAEASAICEQLGLPPGTLSA